jgi:parallel beta-helix repeat protein
MNRRWLLILALAILPKFVLARELVVSQNNPAANDGNPGTRQKPLKTIAAATVRIQPGDKVIIHAGQYRETVVINASGTVEAPITIEAAPGETVVIKGSDILRNWSRHAGDVWKSALPPIIKRSSDSKDTSFWRTNDVRLVFTKDGPLLDARYLRRVLTKDQLKPGSFFCDVSKEMLYVWLSDSSDPNKQVMEVALRGAWLYVNGSNIIIRRLQMRHCSTLGIATWSACRLGGENSVMEDCVISWGDFVGASLAGKNNKMIHSTIACHGNSGLNATGSGHLIAHCRVIYNNIDRYDLSWHCGGAKLIPHYSSGEIRQNEFAYNIGPGLWLDNNCNENLIEGNLCHDNEGPGIMVEVCRGNRVFNNISSGNRNPTAGEYLKPDNQNKFVSTHYDAKDRLRQVPYHAGDGRGIYISSSPDTKVFNNTCYLNEGEGICAEGPVRETEGMILSTHGCNLTGNISVYNKGSQLVIRRNGTDKATYDNSSDYNILFALGAVFARGGWDGTIASSLKTWQHQSGQDQHSIEADPFFAMAAMQDFRLLPGSPALNAGQARPEIQRDFFGHTRPQNSASIGACEAPALDYPIPATFYLGLPENP